MSDEQQRALGEERSPIPCSRASLAQDLAALGITPGMTLIVHASLARIGLVVGGAPAVILGPGEPTLAHQTDEWCSLTRLEQSTDLFRTLMKNWCGV